MRFKNYFNQINKNNRIYSRDDIREMRIKDFLSKEEEVMSQYDAIGLPRTEELKQSPNVNYIEDSNEALGGRWESVGVNGVNGGTASSNGFDGMTGGAASLQAGEMPAQVQGLGLKTGINGGSPSKPLGLESQPQVQSTQNWGGNISQNLQQAMTTTQEGIMSGGAAGINQGKLETLKNENLNAVSVKPMSAWENLQYNAYTNWSKDQYPISSLFVRDAMNNLQEAKSNSNTLVLDNLQSLKQNIKQGLKNLGATDDSSVVIYDINSNVSKHFSQSLEIQNIVNDKVLIDKILNNDISDNRLMLNFSCTNPLKLKEFDSHSSIQHAYLYNPTIKNGYLYGTIVDYYDFEKRSASLKNIPNNWGADMQSKGILTPYGICIKVKVKL